MNEIVKVTKNSFDEADQVSEKVGGEDEESMSFSIEGEGGSLKESSTMVLIEHKDAIEVINHSADAKSVSPKIEEVVDDTPESK